MAPSWPQREPVDSAPLAGPTVLSAFGGAVYLLNVAVDLSLGEILWRACLPEGHVLARAITAIVGGPGDPAPAVLGGVAPKDSLPPVAADVNRLDQAFVNRAMIHRLQAVRYEWGRPLDAEARRDSLSDHAALILDFDSADVADADGDASLALESGMDALNRPVLRSGEI